jgi:DNA-binding protein HU-beta
MNKNELIAAVATAQGVTKKQAEENIQAVLGTITSALVAGDSVAVRGFGTFKVKQSKAREGRNPSTGETIQIPAKKSVSFKGQIEL